MARFGERLLLLVSAFVTYFLLISCTEFVPVILWQQHSGDGEELSSNSLVYSLTRDEFMNDVLKKLNSQLGPIVLFTNRKLSLEDFTLYGNAHNESVENGSFKNLQLILKNNPASMLPSVQFPVDAVKEYASGRKIYELNNADELPEDSDNSLFIFRFADGKDRKTLLEKNDQLLAKIVKAFATKYHAFTGIFTGESSSWVEPEVHRVERHILSTDPAGGYRYINTSCFVIYFENVTFNYYNTSGNGKPVLLLNDTVPPDSFADKSPTECTQNFTQIILQYNNDPSSIFNYALITMSFELKSRNDWYLTEFILQYTLNGGSTEKQTASLSVKDIWAPKGFSFHCSPANFKQDLYNFTALNFAEVYFENFQVQPFNTTNGVFGDPWDCVGFFTIGIWMAIFTIAVLIIVLGFGIYISFIIKTMDRFDDPKGKTITVTASD